MIINYYKRRAEGVVHIKSNEKFTQRAELAIENARAAAGELGHGYVGTEHLLLGIIAEKDGLGARILRSQGLDGERLRGIIIRRSGVGSPAKPSQGLTERAQRAVERGALPSAELHRHRAPAARPAAPERLRSRRRSARGRLRPQ